MQDFVLSMQARFASWILQLHADTCRARRSVQVRIDELDRRSERPARKRWRGNRHGKSFLEKRQILLVSDELEPHRAEVRDLEELFALLHVLSLVDIAFHDGAGDWRKNFDE